MKQSFFALLLVAAPVLAHAESPAPRTIDMTVTIKDQNNHPIPDPTQAASDDPKCQKCGPLTLGHAVAAALLSEHRDDQNLNSVEKAKRAALALRVMDETTATLTAKETSEIIRLMNVWGPVVLVRALPLLDPNVFSENKP